MLSNQINPHKKYVTTVSYRAQIVYLRSKCMAVEFEKAVYFDLNCAKFDQNQDP